MNANTKYALENFIAAVENLTSGVILTIGVEAAAEILSACSHLRVALKADETIV